MAFKILKSALDQSKIKNVDELLIGHAVELKAWREHMAIVNKENETPLGPQPAWTAYKGDVKKYQDDIFEWTKNRDSRHAPYPAPILPPFLEGAINADGEPEYVIVNDDPTAEDVLRDKKQKLLLEVSQAEDRAIEKINPAAKRRHLNLITADIMNADQVRYQTVVDDLKAKDSEAIPAEAMKEKIRSMRSDDDNRHLDDHESRNEKTMAIVRKAAKAHFEIEDLTAENVDAYVIPNFEA